MQTRSLNAFTRTLLIIAALGAVNWGMIGFFNVNLVETIFSGGGSARTAASGFARLLYALVGVAGLASLLLIPKVHANR